MALAAACFVLAASLLLVSSSAVDSKKNPADELVAAVNNNRTAHKSPALKDNAGLGCIALQYIKAYQGKCSDVGGSDAKKPLDAEFAETFAPNCGVQVPTLAPITGRLLACQSKYIGASEVFSNLLMQNGKSLDIVYNKVHTEVGAAVTGTDGGAPYFWCILFSSGKTNSSFVLDGGEAKSQRPGCYSGTNDDCSAANGSPNHLWPLALGILVAVAYAFGV